MNLKPRGPALTLTLTLPVVVSKLQICLPCNVFAPFRRLPPSRP